jgi:hypothetical protein
MWLCYPLAVAWVIYATPPVPDSRLPLRKWLIVTFLSVSMLFILFIGWPMLHTGLEPVHVTPSSGRGRVFLLELTASRFGTALMGGCLFYRSALVCYVLVWAAPQVLIRRRLTCMSSIV